MNKLRGSHSKRPWPAEVLMHPLICPHCLMLQLQTWKLVILQRKDMILKHAANGGLAFCRLEFLPIFQLKVNQIRLEIFCERRFSDLDTDVQLDPGLGCSNTQTCSV